MSELNWYWAYTPYLDAPEKQKESAINAGYGKVVFKSEADKVIAELKEKLDLYKRGWTENDKVNAHLYAELRHQKYKRCLAMARWCSAELGMLVSTWEFKNKHYKKWHKRWLELAEKLKEGLVIGVDKAIGTDKTVVINYKEAK